MTRGPSALLFATTLLLASCAPGGAPRAPMAPAPRIGGYDAVRPMVVGTEISVRGLGLDRVGPVAELVVRAGEREWILPEATALRGTSAARPFLASNALVSELGVGAHAVTLVVRGDETNSSPFETTFEIGGDLALALDAGPSGVVHFEDVVVVHGAGVTPATEAPREAHVVGTFTPAGGSGIAIDVLLPAELADLSGRDRAVMVLGTELGGPTLREGTLVGTMTLEAERRDGTRDSTPPVDVSLDFAAPELFALDPTSASVGRIVTVRGAGFLGRPGRSDETTILRVAAMFTPDGGTAGAFDMELVPTWTSGAELGLVIEPRVTGGAVVASLFGAQRGVLVGTATPVAIRGTAELVGAPVPFSLALGPIHQIVELRFLPGWYGSLTHLGLGAAEPQVKAAIEARIESIYEGYAVDVRTSAVTDHAPSAFAVVEIGGPDPNGSGLFGYDNSAGKDVGNLRLFDHIGGANAETQMDGFPGYGGVFVESMLWWSSHPELASQRPIGAPPPEPLFDEVFDPVRAEPATYEEAMGNGEPARVAVVARAIRALSSLVGETTAHELGHSLGLAQPNGDPTAFHDVGDGEGCLMDSGSARPLGERMAEPGFATSHFCYDEPEYLASILAVE